MPKSLYIGLLLLITPLGYLGGILLFAFISPPGSTDPPYVQSPRTANDYIKRANHLAYPTNGDDHLRLAVQSCDRAIELKPTWGEAYSCRVLPRLWLGDRSGAIADLKKAKHFYLQQGDMNQVTFLDKYYDPFF